MSAWPATGGFEPFPSEVPSLICALAMNVGVAPVGVAMLQNSCMVVLVAEFRASCQQTAILPDKRLLAIRGRNWLRDVAWSFTRIGGLLQVAPSLSENRTIILVSPLPTAVSSV